MSVYLSYLYGLIVTVGLSANLFRPNLFWWTGVLILFLNVFFIWLTVRTKFDINFWNFLISPFIFLFSGLIFLGFSGDFIIKVLIILFLAIANIIFLYRLITFIHHREKYKDHSLSTISRIINLSSIFFWFTSVFNLYTFFKIPLWILSFLSIAVLALITYQFFSISKIIYIKSRLFIWITTLMLVELFYIISWLPLLSMVKAILITSAYYFITSLSRHYIQTTLAKTVYIRYSLITALIWILSLVSARWE